jgi:hypothetical protein
MRHLKILVEATGGKLFARKFLREVREQVHFFAIAVVLIRRFPKKNSYSTGVCAFSETNTFKPQENFSNIETIN